MTDPWVGCGNEREDEIPWLLSRPIMFPALDVGCTESVYLDRLVGPVDGIDVRAPRPHHAMREQFQADIRTWLAPQRYPSIIALSTLEHVGLEFAPYGTLADDVDKGDREALEGCMRNLTDDGVLYLTVPLGPEHENRGWYRRYSPDTLRELLRDYRATIEARYEPAWDVGGVAMCEVRHP